MATGRITGRVEVLVNGQTLLNKAGASASGIGKNGKPAVELEAVMGDNGIHGYIEKPVPATCEVPITDRDDIMLSDFADIRENGTVVLRASGGGKVYTLKEATCLGNFTVKGGEGEVVLRFTGSSWSESTSAT